MEILKHPWKQFLPWSLCFLSIMIHQTLSARTLASPPSTSSQEEQTHRAIITFYTLDVLSDTRLSSRPAVAAGTDVNGGGERLPSSAPQGVVHRIPFTGGSVAGAVSSQTLDLEEISLSFPAVATLQELEFGTVTAVDEDVYGVSGYGYARVLGRLRGMYVAGSEHGSSSSSSNHMMAVTMSFTGSEHNDELRFFGVHRPDVTESHVSVIGGAGKYHSANGYATVRALNQTSGNTEEEKGRGGGAYKVLEFNVYLG